MGNRTDDDLMRALQSGDAGAFEMLVERYRHRLSAFVSGMAHDPATVDDVVQETFIRVYEGRGDYIPTGHFKAWAYTIARNLCMDRFRRPVVRSLDLNMPLVLWSWPGGGADGQPADEWAARDEQLERIRKAAENLSGPMREVVRLKYYHGLKLKEIAEITGSPLGTVKSRLHHALKRIRKMIAE